VLQKAKPTVKETLAGPYNLVVGFNCREDGDCNASGDLYVDSNIIFNFDANETGLTFQSNCTNPSYILQNISVYGLKVTACLNISFGTNTEASCVVTEGNQVLEIMNLQIDLCNHMVGQIRWEITNIPEVTTSATETSTKTEVTTETKTTTEVQRAFETEATTNSVAVTDTNITTESITTTEPEATEQSETTIKPEATTKPETVTETGITEPETAIEPQFFSSRNSSCFSDQNSKKSPRGG
jgi:hypothetical protein